jgi:hypothetical protein
VSAQNRICTVQFSSHELLPHFTRGRNLKIAQEMWVDVAVGQEQTPGRRRCALREGLFEAKKRLSSLERCSTDNLIISG